MRVGTSKLPGPATGMRYSIGLSAYPQVIAMWARRFMIETGATEEDLSAVALAQRKWAELNDRAVIRKPLTPEDYWAAPYVAEPFRIPDCTTEVDGACAVLVTSSSEAKDLRHDPATIVGAGYAVGPRSGLDMGDASVWDDQRATSRVLSLQISGRERELDLRTLILRRFTTASAAACCSLSRVSASRNVAQRAN